MTSLQTFITEEPSDEESESFWRKKGGGNAIGAYIMMDLDNLKIVNDTYGHEYGDKYIRCASDAMREGLGDEAIYSRISGDEFNAFNL